MIKNPPMKYDNIEKTKYLRDRLDKLSKPSHYHVDELLDRAEQAFRIRQYALNEHQRNALKDYGRTLVEEAVKQLEELNDTTK